MRPWLAAPLLLIACRPAPIVEIEDDDGATGTTPTTTSNSTSGGTTSSPSTSGPSTTSTSDDSTSSDDGVDIPGGYLLDPDAGWQACSIFDQNCPPGEKCMPYANDGGNSWNDTRCSPIARDPDRVGESCTVTGSGVSGIDSCDLGAMCWDVDPETDTGTCVPFCVGSENFPDCEYPGHYCSIGGEGVLALCLAHCDAVAQDCPAGQGCYPVGDAVVCAPDASQRDGAFGDPCEFINVCDPGLYCAAAAVVPGCESVGCCTPFCDLGAPDCPGPEWECTAFFEAGQAPPTLEHVGVCQVP